MTYTFCSVGGFTLLQLNFSFTTSLVPFNGKCWTTVKRSCGRKNCPLWDVRTTEIVLICMMLRIHTIRIYGVDIVLRAVCWTQSWGQHDALVCAEILMLLWNSMNIVSVSVCTSNCCEVVNLIMWIQSIAVHSWQRWYYSYAPTIACWITRLLNRDSVICRLSLYSTCDNLGLFQHCQPSRHTTIQVNCM